MTDSADRSALASHTGHAPTWQDQAAYWDGIFDTIPLPAYVADVESLKLVKVNHSMRQMTGATTGMPCHQAIYQSPTPCAHCPLPRFMASPHPVGEALVIEHFNEVSDRWFQLHESMMNWFDGRLVKHSIAVDISALKDTQNRLVEAHALLTMKSRELEELSITDALTQLKNRRYLDDAIRRENERAARYGALLSVVLIDIDQFKSINDRYGHDQGDAVLVAMAKVFNGHVRKTDIAGRWGGEEFMILCIDSDRDAAAILAEKLRASIESTEFAVAGRITCSFGVGQLGDESLASLLRRVDAALYRAKENGRNRVELAL